jgi:hypothetical protein
LWGGNFFDMPDFSSLSSGAKSRLSFHPDFARRFTMTMTELLQAATKHILSHATSTLFAAITAE